MLIKTYIYLFFILTLSSMTYANNEGSVGDAASRASQGGSMGTSQTNDRASQTPRRGTNPPTPRDYNQRGNHRDISPETESVHEPDARDDMGAESQDPKPSNPLNRNPKRAHERSDAKRKQKSY